MAVASGFDETAFEGLCVDVLGGHSDLSDQICLFGDVEAVLAAAVAVAERAFAETDAVKAQAFALGALAAEGLLATFAFLAGGTGSLAWSGLGVGRLVFRDLVCGCVVQSLDFGLGCFCDLDGRRFFENEFIGERI